MGRDYFLLVSGEARSQALGAVELSMALQASGMHLRATLGAASLFASDESPTLRLHNGGVVVGELFSQSGEFVQDVGLPGSLRSDASVRDHFLSHYWGDYILILPEEVKNAFSVMRSPSHACTLACFHSVCGDETFVTSNITLAARLGLCRRRVDFDHITHRLMYPNIKTSRTGLEDVRELLPGSTIHLGNGSTRVEQSWSPWDFVGAEHRHADPHEAALSIRSAIVSVVTALAARDKSVLLELSGGLDSSIVGVCLSQAHAEVACSTMTTPLPGADEREYGASIAAMLGAELITTELDYEGAPFEFSVPAEFITPAIGPLQHATDTLMTATADRLGVSSFFSGAGGDTIFCYLTNAAPAADAFRDSGFCTGMQAIRDLSTFHQCTYWKAGRLALRKLMQSKGRPYKADRSLLSQHIPVTQPELHPWLTAPNNALLGDRQRISELSSAQFFRDSCPRSLTRPVRMPLLSQPVIEACLRVPSWMWFAGGQNRAIARQAFAEILPPNIFARRSKGTFAPYLGALYRRKIGKMLDFLLDGELYAHNLLDAGALRQFAANESLGKDGSYMRIFQLCALENWVRQQS